jgi:hypothetical protein
VYLEWFWVPSFTVASRKTIADATVSQIALWLFGGSGALLISGLAGLVAIPIRRHLSHRDEYAPSRHEREYIDADLVEQLDSAPYRAGPASADDLRWITTKTAQLHRSHATPYEQKVAWFHRNPTGFWVVRNRHGTLVGSCEMVPVECSVIDDLAAGRIHEREKPPELVIPYRRRQTIRCIYLENTMALQPSNEANPWVLYTILCAAPRMALSLGIDTSHVRIYAMSATHFYTNSGRRKATHERLLRRLGFEVVSERTAQNLRLFGAELDDVIRATEELVGGIEGRRTRQRQSS